jgi:hypothetical protein
MALDDPTNCSSFSILHVQHLDYHYYKMVIEMTAFDC